MSMTVQPARVFPATASQGNPAGVSSISSQTCLRTLALACAILVRVRSSARSRVRRTAESLGAAPSTGDSWSSTSMSAIAVAPVAIAIDVETSVMPRLTCGDVPARVRAASRAAVRPPWSASLRSRTAPTWPTSPFPSAVTCRP
jgi:hypothetical protein